MTVRTLGQSSSSGGGGGGGAGIPNGGSTGQVLAKTSSTDGAASWTDVLTYMKAVREAKVDLGSHATFNIDWSAGGVFKMSPTGNFTLTTSSPPASGRAGRILLEIVNGNGATITLPSGWTFGAAGQPALGTGTDILTAYTSDGGANVLLMTAYLG